MDYREYRFEIEPLLPMREVLIAELDLLGFESFVEEDFGLLAYIQEPGPTEASIRGLGAFSLPEVRIRLSSRIMPRENWNALWEADFEPITVENRVVVGAPFHTELPPADHTLIIQPKMSFGTGHHDTTWLMLKAMLSLDFDGCSVLDMGSGTGILAILAERLGAHTVDAIDIDDWAEENARENALLNACTQIRCETGDAALLEGRVYTAVLANINRNVLLADLPTYAKSLEPEGVLLLSGFFTSDADRLTLRAQECGLRPMPFEGSGTHLMSRNDWCCLRFVK